MLRGEKRVYNLEVGGRRPEGRRRKTWRRVVEEDMRKLMKKQKIDSSGGDSYHVQPQ